MHSTSLSGSLAEYDYVDHTDRLTPTASRASRLFITEDLSAGPGNSGGPVFGLLDYSDGSTDWGVVGVHVGGTSGEDALAVGIDRAVYDLIKEAESTSGGSTLRDDHGDTRSTATTVALNRPVSGNLETKGDIDYFRFVLNSTGTITAYTTGATDTLGTLRNGLGNVIATNDDSGSRENFSIKRELNLGTYYIAVSAYSNEETGTYSLRISFTETETIKLPDLAVNSISVDRRQVVAGEAISVDSDISNQGDKDSGVFTEGLYLSKDRIITTGDTRLANFTKASVGAGTSKRFSFKVVIPKNTTPGTYYIGYILDIGDIIRETNESNNTGSTQIEAVKPALDLILDGSGYVAGENIQHPSGNTFDQVLLTGRSIKLKAKPGRVTRVSFMDINGDIVQVEYSGAGTFTVTLDSTTFKPPAYPSRYNQSIRYVTGKPSIVIEEQTPAPSLASSQLERSTR